VLGRRGARGISFHSNVAPAGRSMKVLWRPPAVPAGRVMAIGSQARWPKLIEPGRLRTATGAGHSAKKQVLVHRILSR